MSMLHKSFKPAKCKTALKLAASRIKLLKNKRDAQLKHLKREVAQLLEAGQDQTARIRVEHVVREEKTVAAYDLIEIYCELIVARLPIIESQKNCPIDLKEAISSVIFASPRCADIPELMDVRKLFTAKYGKDFVSAAVELRPDCGVSRLLVEKLSAKAPDGPTKIKILSAIAEEHNVKWDPNSFEEKVMQPPEDLLNGPNTFQQASIMHAAPHNVQMPANYFDTGPPNAQAPPEYSETHDASTKSYGPYSRSSNTQNFPPTDVGANKAMPSDSSHPALRPLGTETEGIESYSYASHESGFTLGGQNWTMEFKDATAAAQAAAESAERASMAARAAAELSSQGRISRKHSAESQRASASSSTKEGLPRYAGSKLQGENVVNNITYNKIDTGMLNEQSTGNEEDDLASLAERFYSLKSSNKTGQSASSKSVRDSVDDHPPVNDVQVADVHSRKSLFVSEKDNFLGETGGRTESSESEEEFVHKVQDGVEFENVGYFEGNNMKRQSSNIFSHSHSQNFTDDYNVVSHFDHEKSNEETVEDPFTIGEGQTQRNAKETSSNDNATAVFDDSGTDDDEFKFDIEGGHSGRGSSSYFWPEGRRESSSVLADTNAGSPRQNTGESLEKFNSQSLFASEQQSSTMFSEDLKHDVVPPGRDELLPVTFDDSDGPSSESEEELGKSKIIQGTSFGSFPHKEDVQTRNPEPSQNESPSLIGSSLAGDGNVGPRKSGLQSSTHDSDITAETDRSNYGNLDFHQASPRHVKSHSHLNDFSDNLLTPGHSSVRENVQGHQFSDAMEYSQAIEQSSLESGKELNFGILTGGFKNKGYKHPPYRRNSSNNSSLSKIAAEDTPKISSSSSKVDASSEAHGEESYSEMMQPKANEKASSATPITHYDSGSDDSDEEPPQHIFSSNQGSSGRKYGIEGNRMPSSMTYFDSDDSDPDEDLPKQTLTRKTHSSTGFSRRTKATPSNSSSSYSKSSDTKRVVEPKTSSMSSYPTELQPKPQSQRKSSEQQRSEEKESSKPIPRPRSLHGVSSSRSSHIADTPQSPPPQTKSSNYFGSSEQFRSTGQSASKPIQEHKRSSSKENLNSSAREQQSNPSLKSVASVSTENPKTSSSNNEAPSRENSINKASHVHPKLPDYDTFTAHLMSLRQNRK